MMMNEIIHRPVRTGSIGKIDKWGFGSCASTWDYPTLGLAGVILTTTVGGVSYPAIQGVRAEFPGKPYYAPLQHWGDYTPTWTLPDGRVIVARVVDGQKCLVEVS